MWPHRAAEARTQGHDIVNIVRVAPPDGDAGPFAALDMSDYDGLLRAFAGCDAVVHMAIPSLGRHRDHVVHNNNVVGSYNALSAVADLGLNRVSQASSVNPIGLSFSRQPRFEYFPTDENHPNYSEEHYSLSAWICEQQADSFARRYEGITISCIRFHLVVPDRAGGVAHYGVTSAELFKLLWAYARYDAAARACLLSLNSSFHGHEVFCIGVPDTVPDEATLELTQRFFPGAPLRGDLIGQRSFFSCENAERLLGWEHS